MTSQNTKPNTQSPEVINRLVFKPNNVRLLTSSDFNLDTKELISIKITDCILILFYVENTESHDLAEIWSMVAEQTAGPIFGAINMISESRVAQNFIKLKSQPNNPFHWAGLQQYPFILVYRDGWPVAIYNGSRDVQALIDYSLTLACNINYREQIQFYGGMQSDGDKVMAQDSDYYNFSGKPDRVRQFSTQYIPGNPVRGFNPQSPLLTPGTTQYQNASRINTQLINQNKMSNNSSNNSSGNSSGNSPLNPYQQVIGISNSNSNIPGQL